MTRDYQDILERNEKIGAVLPQNHWKAMEHVNTTTLNALDEQHFAQMRENIKSGLWSKHGSIASGIGGMGRNKAVIGIGAGGSLARNMDVLVSLSRNNLNLNLDDQPFMLNVCNHQLKPCLARGIHPHFATLIDGSDVVMDQLNKGIRNWNGILLTGLHANPKVLNEWDRQGRAILFYVGASEKAMDVFRDETMDDPTPYICEEGGNVMNSMWLFAMKFMNSTVFMSVGNDLSYPLRGNLKDRRKAYYADGDYSANLANRRDEARYNFGCMGFEYDFNPILNNWVVNFKPMGTSWQLWTYKRWIETQVTMHENDKKSWHFYNCSESGILGVLSKDDTKKDLMLEKNNYFLMDSVAPKRWHTRRLVDAAGQFMAAREMLCRNHVTRTGIITDVGPVIHSPGKTDFARITASL